MKANCVSQFGDRTKTPLTTEGESPQQGLGSDGDWARTFKACCVILIISEGKKVKQKKEKKNKYSSDTSSHKIIHNVKLQKMTVPLRTH